VQYPASAHDPHLTRLLPLVGREVEAVIGERTIRGALVRIQGQYAMIQQGTALEWAHVAQVQEVGADGA
jgi:hypothetical protein